MEGVGVRHAGRGDHEGCERPILAGTPDPVLPYLLRVLELQRVGPRARHHPPGSADADDTSDTSSTSPHCLTR